MNFVIPMAGHGSRFVKEGYSIPKPLLEAHGKTLLEWSVDSLPLDLCENLIFIGLQEHEEQYHLEGKIRALYEHRVPQISFLWLKSVTRGQAETVYLARDIFMNNMPLVIFNIDTTFTSNSLTEALKDPSSDGVLGAFRSNEPRFSYAKVESDGSISRVVEKEVISEYALTGLYTFANPLDFIVAFEDALEKQESVKGEYYIAPLYDKLIQQGKKLTLNLVDELWILGTPEEYKEFLDRK